MEIFNLAGRIRLDGLDNAIQGVADIGNRFDDAAQRAGKFGETLSNVGDGISKAGGALSTGVTAPLVAMGAAAFSTAADTEKATGKIQAQLGLTAKEAAAMTDQARDLWLNGFGEDMAGASDALAMVGQNMQGLNPDQLRKTTEHAMIFADAFGEDIPASTAAAQVMMKNFGLSAEESFDLMTRGMQEGGNYSGELLDTMREYSPQFASMGMSANDMMNVLISGAEAGAFNMDKVGDAVKEFNIRAQDGSKTTNEGFEAIGLNAAEMGAAIAGGGEKAQGAYQATIAALSQMDNEQERNAAGVALFGTAWEDLGATVVTEMAGATDKLGEVKGATDAAGAALYDNFGARVQGALRRLGAALEPIGVILMDLAERALPVLEQKLETLTNWFGSLTAEQQKFAVILGLAAAAAGPLLLVLGSIVGTVGSAITGFAAMSGAAKSVASALKLKSAAMKVASVGMKLLRGALTLTTGAVRLLGVALKFLATNPIGIAITAIAGLVAIGIYVYKNWDTLGPKIMAIFGKIGDYLKWAGQRIKDDLTSRFAAVVDYFKWAGQRIKDDITARFTAIVDYLRWAGQRIKDDVTGRIEAMKNGVIRIVTVLKDTAVKIFTWYVDGVINLATRLKDGVIRLFTLLKDGAVQIVTKLKDGALRVWDVYYNAVMRLKRLLKDGVLRLYTALKDGLIRAVTAIKDGGLRVWTWYRDGVINIIQRLKDGAVRLFNLLKDGIRIALTTMRDFAVRTFDNMRSRLTTGAQRIYDGLTRAFGNVRNKAKEIFNSMYTTITGRITDIKNAAAELPGKIGTAIKNKISNATDAMKDLASDLISRFKKALGINSPSTVFYDMAGWIIKGLANGLSAANLGTMGKNLFKDFAGGALNSLDSIKGFISGGLGSIGGNFGKGAEKAAGWVRKAMSLTGVDSSWYNALMTIAKKESGFNPGVQNNWDINAKRGIPSKGLFQTIGPTFDAYKMPGLNNILDPVHNAVAAIRYIQSRYGTVFNTPGIASMAQGGAYKGYAKGGVFTGPSVIRVAERASTPVEAAIPLSGRYMWPFADAIGSRIATAGGNQGDAAPLQLSIEVPVFLDGREIARAQAPYIDTELARRQQADARARGRRL